jgi:hypothetical protein
MGVEAIKKRGGPAIVQDKETSEFEGMPQAAFETGAADYVLLEKIAKDLDKKGDTAMAKRYRAACERAWASVEQLKQSLPLDEMPVLSGEGEDASA